MNKKDDMNVKFILTAITHKIYFAKDYVLKNPERLKLKIMKLIQRILTVIYKNKKNSEILSKECKIAKKYKFNESKYVCSYAYDTKPPKEQYILKEYLGEGITRKFEGIEVNIPTNYDAYLTRLYGDYMQLPPEEERVGHHYHEGVDLNKSYKEYIKENIKNNI